MPVFFLIPINTINSFSDAISQATIVDVDNKPLSSKVPVLDIKSNDLSGTPTEIGENNSKKEVDDVMWGKAALATLSKAPTLVLEDDDDEDEDSFEESDESEGHMIERDSVVTESPRKLIRKHGSRVEKKEIGQPLTEGFHQKKIFPTRSSDHEVIFML